MQPRSVQVVVNSLTSFCKDAVTGVTVDGEHVPATAVVLALGPWTNTLEGALGLPHIAGQLGHSLVLKPSRSEALPADCLFVSWRSKTGKLKLATVLYVSVERLSWVCGHFTCTDRIAGKGRPELADSSCISTDAYDTELSFDCLVVSWLSKTAELQCLDMLLSWLPVNLLQIT